DQVSTPQVRCMGTLGGNLLVDPRCNYYNQTYSWRKAAGFCLKKDGDICLVARSSPRCWAVSSSDSAPVALALDATVTLHGVGGDRRVLAPLNGRRPDDALIAEVADAADKPARPLDNTDLSHYWRKRMTRVYIERALREACGVDPLAGRLSAQVKAAAI